MGYKALLADGSAIAPAVEVLDGVLTPRQADKTYKGVRGTCFHCRQRRDRIWEVESAAVQRALTTADLGVHYVSGFYEGESLKRIMHFAHKPGFLRGDTACLICRSASLAFHAQAVEVIRRWATREWPGCDVAAEMNVVLPGTPPQQFRPDITVQSADGKPVACIEYQRTPEQFDAFCRRHELRKRQFPDVRWFFASGAYGSSAQHREYLHDRGEVFYRCWVDNETGRLQVADGRPPVKRGPAPPKSQVVKCSEAGLIQAMEAREAAAPRRAAEALNPQLDLLMVGGSDVQNRPQLVQARQPRPSAAPAVGGLPISVDGQPGWVLPGGLPRAGGVRVLCVSPEGRSVLVERRRIYP